MHVPTISKTQRIYRTTLKATTKQNHHEQRSNDAYRCFECYKNAAALKREGESGGLRVQMRAREMTSEREHILRIYAAPLWAFLPLRLYAVRKVCGKSSIGAVCCYCCSGESIVMTWRWLLLDVRCFPTFDVETASVLFEHSMRAVRFVAVNATNILNLIYSWDILKCVHTYTF